MRLLEDPHGRRFRYLRLSVIDACNFRCTYCLPNGYKRPQGAPSPLSVVEIENTVRALAGLGVIKVRITGGEPTLRRDITQICGTVAAVPGVQRVALTTNGWRLKSLAAPLREAGVTDLNISIDSLDRTRFAAATGVDQLPAVLDGLNASLALRFNAVKLNSVWFKDTGDQDLPLFLEFIRTTPVSVRFIELMATRDNRQLFIDRHEPLAKLRPRLEALGFSPKPRGATDGPAEVWVHPDYAGSVGIIAPYSKDFCSHCNRLRISCRGELHLCLFGQGGAPLRHLLQRPDQEGALRDEILGLLRHKAPSHRLAQGDFGATPHLASIGG